MAKPSFLNFEIIIFNRHCFEKYVKKIILYLTHISDKICVMKTIFILMGVIGAGKSTYAKKLQAQYGGEILSSDEIRKELVTKGKVPEKYDSKYNPMVFGLLHRRARSLAKKGENIIIDSTNIPASSRKPIIKIGNEFGYKLQGELLLLDDEECLRRIAQREKTDKNSHIIANPLEALEIYKQRLSVGMPTLKEGFHQINTYNNGNLIKSESRVLIASTNQGKVEIYANIIKNLGLEYCSLIELNPHIDVQETGETEIENAMIKAKAYHEATMLPVVANDSGLIIEKFSKENQPGVFVRRYGGHELSDEETIKIFSQKLEDVGGSSEGYFNVALAVCDYNGVFHSKLFKSYRYLVAKPSPVIVKGLPLRSLDFNKEYGKYMSEMSVEEANRSEGKTIDEQSDFIKSIFKEC